MWRPGAPQSHLLTAKRLSRDAALGRSRPNHLSSWRKQPRRAGRLRRSGSSTLRRFSQNADSGIRAFLLPKAKGGFQLTQSGLLAAIWSRATSWHVEIKPQVLEALKEPASKALKIRLKHSSLNEKPQKCPSPGKSASSKSDHPGKPNSSNWMNLWQSPKRQ